MVTGDGGETTGVILAVVVVLSAIGLGWLLGGRLGQLAGLTLRWTRLVPVALLAQLVGGLISGPAYAVSLAGSVALLSAFLLRNRTVPGTSLIALGLLSNALVVGLNGAMPVAGIAAGRAGVTTQHLLTGVDRRHELADEHTRLELLSDVIPVPWPRLPEVVSPGDVLIAAGLGELVLLAMTGLGASPGRVRRDHAEPS